MSVLTVIALVVVALGVVAVVLRKRLGRLATRLTGTWIGVRSS
jgi:hypothetical protein